MKNIAVLSLILGTVFGMSCFIFLNRLGISHRAALSVLSAVLFSLLLFSVFFCVHRKQKRIYGAFEKEITSPILFQANGNFNTGADGIKNGRIYFCEAGIVCAFLSDKPYFFEEIPIDTIDRFYFENSRLTIVTKDEKHFIVAMPRIRELVQILKDYGWVL